MILLFTIALSILIAIARGGRIQSLGRISFRYGWIVLLALGVQIALVYWPGGGERWARWIMMATYIALGAVAIVNRRLPGMVWVGAGLALNALVMAINGGYMPIAPQVLKRVGLEHLAQGGLIVGSKDKVLSHGEARLWFLGDVFATRAPFPSVFSAGDCLLAIGFFWLFQKAVLASYPDTVETLDSAGD